jgi:hypothetical protein
MAMSHEFEASDPLSRAIGEFRKELLLWIDTELLRLRQPGQADDLVNEEERQIDPEPRPFLSNPRQRLDALARLLDHRLKQAQEAAAPSGGAGNGLCNGVEDDTP